ncbi:hypothetical protein BUALT_Bualt06G0068500 [Buddleja alternifolia]|uniref:Retrotransposon gag domain-containing protein n=1 Tax=Buddleja alternifolia TaxID=168488 RepID=A0AAV6XK20_9LAMI|nr:hypothetical protein BUALT_Bualt06G0068500 [Buddleja alternifolia]
MAGRPRSTNQNPSYATNSLNQNGQQNPEGFNEQPNIGLQNNPPPIPAFNQHPNPQVGLRQEDLVFIATVVAQVIQGQQNAPAVAKPTIKGTKSHCETLRRAHVTPKVVVPFLVGEAARWWEGVSPPMMAEGPITWVRFRESYLKHLFPNAIHLQKMAEFDSITQLPDMSVLEYLAKFHSLGKYSPTIMGNPQLKMHMFTKGLKIRIRSALAVFEVRNFDELLGANIRAKAYIKRRDEENKLKRPRTGMNLGQGSRMITNATQVGHKVSECKVPENDLTKAFMPRTNGARQNGNARLYSMTKQEADNVEDVVTDMESLKLEVVESTKSTLAALSDRPSLLERIRQAQNNELKIVCERRIVV